MSRSPSLNGFSWTITFLSDTSTKNQGNQVMLEAGSLAAAGVADIVVQELVPGSRDGGYSEEQIITITSTGSSDVSLLGGWFRLSFDGSDEASEWLPVDASADLVTRALQQLNTIRTVTVNFDTDNVNNDDANDYAFNRWTVTFTGNVGRQPGIDVESTFLTTSATTLTVAVDKGDNSLSGGTKATAAMPGETPKGYLYEVVGADQRSFTIPELVPGKTYYAAVSAINRIGNSPTTMAATPSITPPKQISQPPVGVGVSVHTGSASTLDVSWDTPLSDGGSEILNYRVELDISTDFTNPIYNIVPCYPASKHTVYEVKTSGLTADPLVGGSFTLTLSVDGSDYTTTEISYDATAASVDEIGIRTQVPQVFATTLAAGATFVTTDTADTLIFKSDRLQLTEDPLDQVYTVTDVSTDGGGVTTVTVFPDIATTGTTKPIYRYLGGRDETDSTGDGSGVVVDHGSYVGCVSDPAHTTHVACPANRAIVGGSMQTKLQMIPEVFTKGVAVDRDIQDSLGGVTWRVTFLDDAKVEPNDFALSIDTNSLVTEAGVTGDADCLTVTQLVIGSVAGDCIGTHEIPNDKALANGQFYYARVFAINEVGYSLPQVSPSKQKPQVAPGPPLSPRLSIFSQEELKLCFNAPASNGGDTITSYMIEYATAADFSNKLETFVTQIDAGGELCKTISGLSTGVFYFVRVSAANSQGYGLTTSAGSLNPHRAPDAPTGVNLRVTSDSMLTVSFANPVNDGGDAVTFFRVEWDTVVNFNSIQTSPHKGFVDISAATDSSYTITALTTNRPYFVRVAAKNSAGFGVFTYAQPSSAAPLLEVPGKPHTILATTGSGTKGTIHVSWLRPTIPWHEIPCGGFPANPKACPATSVASTVPLSNGGATITEYVVSYNEQADFNGFDFGEQTTTGFALELTNLTPGRAYYIRVLARNSQGSGEFCSFTDANCLAPIATNRISAKAAS